MNTNELDSFEAEDCNFGLGMGEMVVEKTDTIADILGDNADFVIPHTSRFLKPHLPDYVIEAMKKQGRHFVNMNGVEIKVW